MWTKVITKENKNVSNQSLINKALRKTFENHQELKFANEYYHVDNLLYEDIHGGYEKIEINKRKYKAHRWSLLAAVEHENQWDDWSDELVKLTYIDAPFRVIISYGDYSNDYEDEVNFANFIASQIHLSDHIRENQEFLLIFGPRYKSELKNKKLELFFKAFIYAGEEFIAL